MKYCKDCSLCKINIMIIKNSKAKFYKCKYNPSKKFSHPTLHGWFCKYYIKRKRGIL